MDVSWVDTLELMLKNSGIDMTYEYFLRKGDKFGCAYCLFLKGNLFRSYEIFKLLENSNPAVDWFLALSGLMLNEEGKQNIVYNPPTYFQIRNFFEITLEKLFWCKNIEFIKKICIKLGYFAKYNREVFKYTARVFIDNGGSKEAIYFLKKSIEICYNDPEVHFMLADVYLKLGDINKARIEYQKSNDVVGGYYPAKEKLKYL